MTESDFHDKVLSELSDVKADVRAVVARLDKVNGSVARHQEELGKLQIELAERRLSCPLVDAVKERMDAVEDFIIADNATAKANSHWLNRLWPAFYAAAGVTVYVAALHANDILKSLSR